MIKFDGKDHQSRVGLDTVAVKRIDAQTVERSGKVGEGVKATTQPSRLMGKR